MSDIFPSPSILVRLRLKIRGQIRRQQLDNDVDNYSPEELVNMTKQLPSFAIAELWEDFHIGSNLDSGNQQILRDWLNPPYNINYLDYQAKRLYGIVKSLIEEMK